MYEAITADQVLIPNLPVMVRIDGKAFHTWTRGLERPFSTPLQNLFDDVTIYLVSASNAVVGYTQSDEITLVLWNYNEPDSQILFNGRVSKLNSVLASMATARFNQLVPLHLPDKEGRLAFFDCRVWNVPNVDEAINCLIWRELDATRNSIQSAAYALYSQKQLHLKNTSEMQEMVFQKGINWNDYPTRFKRGGYFKRRLIEREFTSNELENLPPQHEAHSNKELLIKRHIIERLDLPPLQKVTNRHAVIFEGAQPFVAETSTVAA
jgi:tRNA(His) 5'-end guanylyltransferase